MNEALSDAELARQLRKVLAKSLIEDAMFRYARGVDRRDWKLMRSAFHDDAHDDHGGYKGSVDGFVDWVSRRHATMDHSMHMLGNCFVEFFGEETALVETYFLARRAMPGSQSDGTVAAAKEPNFFESMGRYVDRFELRRGEWRIAHRIVVHEAKFTTVVQLEDRSPPTHWASRDSNDALIRARAELQRQFGPPG